MWYIHTTWYHPPICLYYYTIFSTHVFYLPLAQNLPSQFWKKKKTRQKEGSLLYPNLLKNGLCGSGVQHRWKSNKFTLHGNLSVNNIKLFPDSPLEKKIVIQSNSQDIISNEGMGMCSTKYEPNIACAVVCYIPASFHLIFMIKMIHLLHQQMLWIYYRLVAFHICNSLPLKHDNKSCVKKIAYTQLKRKQTVYSFDILCF